MRHMSELCTHLRNKKQKGHISELGTKAEITATSSIDRKTQLTLNRCRDSQINDRPSFHDDEAKAADW